MAKIPVEHNSGTPWWLWLLGLILLVGLIWWGIDAMNDDEDLADMDGDDYEELAEDRLDDMDPVATVEPLPVVTVADENTGNTTGTGTITSVASLLNADDIATLAGREVELTDVIVPALRGDSTFWITPQNGSDRKLLVVLSNLGEWQDGPGTGVDGRYDVNQGAAIDLEGTIVRVQPNDPDRWGLTQTDVEGLRQGNVYLRADALDIEQ